jgi:hypothetical protein
LLEHTDLSCPNSNTLLLIHTAISLDQTWLVAFFNSRSEEETIMHILNRSIWGRALTIALVMILLTSSVALAAKPIVIKTPINGEVVSGLYLVTGTGGGAATQVSIDGGTWQANSGGKNWSYSWDTTIFNNGSHTVSARYTDGSGTTSVNVRYQQQRPRQPSSVSSDQRIERKWHCSNQ